MENHDNIRPGDVSAPPENYLVWAILCTVLCCLPLGIVAIIKSQEVNKLWAQGDYAGAQKASADTKKYATWGAIAAAIGWILYILFFVVIGFGAATADAYSGY